MWGQEKPEGHVYELAPIDWWIGWSTLDEIAARFDPEDREDIRKNLEETRDHALDQFRARTMWEGDVVAGPVFSGLPPESGDPTSDVMVAIKQLNNGMVFVWSPYPLTWLRRD